MTPQTTILYIPAVDQQHADDIWTMWQMVDDETGLMFLDVGLIGRTRADAQRFIDTLGDDDPGKADASVFEVSYECTCGVAHS